MKEIKDNLVRFKNYASFRFVVYIIFSAIGATFFIQKTDTFIALLVISLVGDYLGNIATKERISRKVDEKILVKNPGYKKGLKILNGMTEDEIDEDIIADIVSDSFIQKRKKD